MSAGLRSFSPLSACVGEGKLTFFWSAGVRGIILTLDPAWVALSLVEHVGAKKLRALSAYFNGDLAAALSADAATLRRVPGIGPKIAASIRAIDLSAVEEAIPRWREAGITLLTLNDPAYPRLLLSVDDAPPTLFVCGTWREQGCVAVVGTRSPMREAAEAARQLGFELVQRGYQVISGMALGIDSAAHIGALAQPAGVTSAVLGSGVLKRYPPENRALAQAILQRGALLSETHPNAQPKPSTLVARNRIISGLCEALIVVQTEVDGGAMHAARRALEQGRRVYTLEDRATGNRALIDSGAEVITPELAGFL
ncbi:MAG: DNA-protecting protein DprA [Chloroflexi bacterium]|nr:DNA-protecting protein DprA [Chloroflexota bacterium]